MAMCCRSRKCPDKFAFKWLTTLIWLENSLASSPKHFSFPQYGTGICFQTLNRITERKQEKYYKGRPGLIPGASTLTAMYGNYAKEGSVFAKEHSAIVKYK